MAYGLKYQSQFDSQSDANNAVKTYTIQFLFKDYTGDAISVTGAETSVIQSCSNDDPLATIKGQSLSIRLLNSSNSLPINSFESEDDDGVQVKLLDENSNILFIGYLVQDDFNELMVDYPHAITLSANDSLGLLKGVILSDAMVRRRFIGRYRTNTIDTQVYIHCTDNSFYPQAGDTIELVGITYTILTAARSGLILGFVLFNWVITVDVSTGGIALTTGYIYLTGIVDLTQRNSLLSLIAMCVAQTNLSLTTYIYHTLVENRQLSTVSTFEQTLIASDVFISRQSYMNCYDVLTYILETFNCTIFQANGNWNIVNWLEARRTNTQDNKIYGFVYDETWTAAGRSFLDNTFNIGPAPQLTRPTFELNQTFFRGHKFSRKQFDYVKNKYALKNYDLLNLGPLIRTYISGVDTVREYVANHWLDGDTPTYVERFIRVTTSNITGVEVQRFLVVKGDPGTLSYSKSVKSQPIEVHKNDKITLSFSVRGVNSYSGSWNLEYAVMLIDGGNTAYVDDLPAGAGAWINTIGFYFNGSGTNTNEWHNIEIASSAVPYNGLLYCYLTQLYANGDETQYKDIRFDNTFLVNDSLKIIGQSHKQTQPPNKKLFEDVNIKIDDSPRSLFDGTLFNTTKTGLLQDRTISWRYPNTYPAKLGENICLDELIWRRKTRSKMEGGFIGNFQQNIISLLTIGIVDMYPNKVYTFGMLSIDYKKNQFSGTLWELYDRDDDPIFDNTYEFKYIYETI